MKPYLLLLAFFISSLVQAEPIVKSSFTYYKVYPASKNDLARAMMEASPIKENGRAFMGDTRWHVLWDFKWNKNNNICTITSANTSLNISYTMPALATDVDLTEDTRQAFDGYYAALFKHEQEHMYSGLYAAREIEQALLSLGSFERCKRLEYEANTSAKKILKKYYERDKEYDKKTDHGRTEGVDFNLFNQ